MGIGVCILLTTFGLESDDIQRMVKGISMDGKLIFGLMFGVLEFYVTFFADFNCQMQQSAIGNGISRKRIVLSKYAELAIYIGLDCLIVLSCAVLVGKFLYGHMEWIYISNMMASILGIYIKVIGVMAMATLLVYLFNNVIFGLIAYLIFFNFGYTFEEVLLGWAPVVNGLRLSDYLLVNACESFSGMLSSGKFRADLLAALIIEIVILLLITI